MVRRLTKRLRRPARALARFCRARRGATAVEFALIAPAFLGVLIGIFQMTLYLFAQQILQNAAVEAGRLIMTGQVQAATMTQSNFQKNDVCPLLLSAMFTCANVYVNIDTYVDFEAANTGVPTLTYSNGSVSNTWDYNIGSPGQVMVLQLIYPWPIIAGPLGSLLPSISGDSSNQTALSAISVFRIEPY